MDVAVVTGGARGLGRLIAERLVRRGLMVVITDVLEDELTQTAAQLGDQVVPILQDVRDPETHREVAKHAAKFGRLRVWVNNAGVLRSNLGWDHPDDEVRLQFDVNALGVIYGSSAAVSAMKQHGGHIINIASISSHIPVRGLAVYAATKHAVYGYTTSLQADLAAEKLPIRISALCPDAIETDLVRNVVADEHASMLFASPKLLDPADVADEAVALLDNHKLLRILPPVRGVLAFATHPWPQLGLRAMRFLERRGEKHRQQRS